MPDRRRHAPTRAAALRYDPKTDTAPVLTAFGQGHMADRLVQKAREAGVPVQQDAGLAGLLALLSVGDEIPPQLYEVVARILVFVAEVDRRHAPAPGPRGGSL